MYSGLLFQEKYFWGNNSNDVGTHNYDYTADSDGIYLAILISAASDKSSGNWGSSITTTGTILNQTDHSASGNMGYTQRTYLISCSAGDTITMFVSCHYYATSFKQVLKVSN